jgi:antitoxin (DNA-binding transcriptional repressor) of toxin-antitoxin stability system
MRMTNIHAAKSHLSKWVELASQGEEIIICKAGKPMAKLIQFQNNASRMPDCWKGKIVIHKDFDVLPPDIAAAFKGENP